MKEVIDFKIGCEYKEGDILKTREGVYLLVEKPDNKNCAERCYSCWFQNAPWDACIQMDCTAGNFYFRPFEEHHKETEYIIGDLLKIPKFGEPGKFILSMVVEDDIIDEFNNSGCGRCTFNNWIYHTGDCCSKNKCVDCLRDTNKDDVYYKPLAEVSE